MFCAAGRAEVLFSTITPDLRPGPDCWPDYSAPSELVRHYGLHFVVEAGEE
jgi:hypothetical protein